MTDRSDGATARRDVIEGRDVAEGRDVTESRYRRISRISSTEGRDRSEARRDVTDQKHEGT